MAVQKMTKVKSQTSTTTPKPLFEIKTTVFYVERESHPAAGIFFFTYHITITNKGNSPAQLMSRHWIVTDSHGRVEEVRGAGVVGKQPHILPGQSFEYDSACPLSTSCGSMRGNYQFTTGDGATFDVEIPEFYLIAPSALH